MNSIQNFNIPVLNFDRALEFYSELMGYKLQCMEFNEIRLGLFEFDHLRGGIGGALIKSDQAKPSKDGTIVFLQTENDLQDNLDRIAHRKLLLVSPKTPLGIDMGYFSIIEDTEGNRVGLYSKT